jgi:hypothetical protein
MASEGKKKFKMSRFVNKEEDDLYKKKKKEQEQQKMLKRMRKERKLGNKIKSYIDFCTKKKYNARCCKLPPPCITMLQPSKLRPGPRETSNYHQEPSTHE